MYTRSQYLEAILRARVYDVAAETPLEESTLLSRRLGNTVLLKREDLQTVFSFKLRGAYNKISSLTKEERTRGVVCSSAGNHAQGVALACHNLGIRAVIVMPTTTPGIKIDAVRDLGGEVILFGEAYDDAQEHAGSIAEREGLCFVHPFDDPAVIAGQGTVGMEILRQLHKPPNAIFVPVGGGGLIAGIALYTKALFPDVRIIGVEPEESPSMYRALEAGEPVALDHIGIFADGVAVRRVGAETFRIAQDLIERIVLVSTDEICAATQDIFEDTRSIVEPAGALGVAGVKRFVAETRASGQVLVAVNSGANMNFHRLRHVAERAAIGEQREALLAVEIPERAGAFLDFCATIGTRSVTEFNYRYRSGDRAMLFVGLETQPGESRAAGLIERLSGAGYPVQDLSENELAKLHVRYMIGGPCSGVTDEHVFRLEVPEHPGALMRFLEAICPRWNISLFHYRNHGSDYGRVLVGVQVAAADLDALRYRLEDVGYPFVEETANAAYLLFLNGKSA